VLAEVRNRAPRESVHDLHVEPPVLRFGGVATQDNRSVSLEEFVFGRLQSVFIPSHAEAAGCRVRTEVALPSCAVEFALDLVGAAQDEGETVGGGHDG
jgi:hypothetical protein